jgi:hypothetical protein
MTLAAFNTAGKRDRFATDWKDRPMNRPWPLRNIKKGPLSSARSAVSMGMHHNNPFHTSPSPPQNDNKTPLKSRQAQSPLQAPSSQTALPLPPPVFAQSGLFAAGTAESSKSLSFIPSSSKMPGVTNAASSSAAAFTLAESDVEGANWNLPMIPISIAWGSYRRTTMTTRTR